MVKIRAQRPRRNQKGRKGNWTTYRDGVQGLLTSGQNRATDISHVGAAAQTKISSPIDKPCLSGWRFECRCLAMSFLNAKKTVSYCLYNLHSEINCHLANTPTG